MTDAHQPGTIPQSATNLLTICVQALRHGDRDRPLADWLRERAGVGASARRQVSSLLRFLGLLDQAGCLAAEAVTWRADQGLLAQELVRCFRTAYTAAGCEPFHAELVGNPAISEESLRKLLKDEPPFKKLRNRGTRENAMRFACHVHQAIVTQTLLPEADRGEVAGPEPRADHSSGSPPAEPSSQPPRGRLPTVHDLGTTVNPQRYRVARLHDDTWVYGLVHFECPSTPAAPAWLAPPDPAEQARWLEQLAGCLLHAADALRQQDPTPRSR